MSGGWTGSSMEAYDVGDRAWARLGASRAAAAFGAAPSPFLVPFLEKTNPEVDRLARLVLDHSEVSLVGDARERVVQAAQKALHCDVIWAVTHAIERELLRPDPIPYTPPPVGSWVRSRWTSTPRRTEPEWDGKWHRFTGDLVTWRGQVNRVAGRTACGYVQTLMWPAVYRDAVVSDDGMPAVDYCRKCARA